MSVSAERCDAMEWKGEGEDIHTTSPGQRIEQLSKLPQFKFRPVFNPGLAQECIVFFVEVDDV